MVEQYLPFMCGLVLICGVSFWDDVHSLPDSVRLVAQFVAMALMFYQLIIDSGQLTIEHWWGWVLFLLTASIVFVGATNIINFMDGINGITAAYSLAVLVPLLMLDVRGKMEDVAGFIEPSYLIVTIIGVLVQLEGGWLRVGVPPPVGGGQGEAITCVSMCWLPGA